MSFFLTVLKTYTQFIRVASIRLIFTSVEHVETLMTDAAVHSLQLVLISKCYFMRLVFQGAAVQLPLRCITTQAMNKQSIL